ncbi:ABC transporter permease subunit [Paenibacillus filicis]|uniref:ABC transporter permease subunit n=1 Tax=Paenibacillus gyeongsangnamensis TaxID=3388067 RepID=A0ABT4Q8Q6_9BACL|nr:ABC transporter permease subunit [Paenibacillus filicis]MCZ8513209.1 ABC transporter permease subunit [Paenibacillus filicis]
MIPVKALGAEQERNFKRRIRFRKNIPLMLMFFPVAVYFIVFKYVPMLGSVIAFKQYNFSDGILGSPWVGLDNFRLLFSNPQMVNTIRNTLLLSALKIAAGFPFPILLAILLNEVRKAWFKKTVQTLVYLPHFFNWIIVSGIVITIFSQENGVINHLIVKWGGTAYPFLYKELSWIVIFLGSGIWKEVGFSTIVYLAAITSIDPSLYESAGMDGANKWRQIWHITLPSIRPTIVLLLILSMGSVMEVSFDQIYLLQNSVVSNVSEVISTFIYQAGLQGGQFSITSAMGLFESLVGLILVIASNQIARKFKQGLW